MKTFLIFLLVVLVVAALWWQFGRHRGEAEPILPADPAAAVDSFMSTMAQLSALMWEEEQRERLAAEAEELEARGEKTTREEAADLWQRYGLRSPLYLFADADYGKAVQATFLMHRFDSYELGTPDRGAGTARVEVRFMPKDVLGMNEAIRKAGAPPPAGRREPVTVVYRLEQHGEGWRITGLSGPLDGAIDAFYRLSQTR